MAERAVVMGVCSEPPSSRLHCEASNHICFYSKQSGADTAGSLSLLLKAFWGLLRDGPDGVIYPLFAEWTRIECDVYGHGIPISHPCQGHLPRRTDESRHCSATGWNCASHPLLGFGISLWKVAYAGWLSVLYPKAKTAVNLQVWLNCHVLLDLCNF